MASEISKLIRTELNLAIAPNNIQQKSKDFARPHRITG